MLELFRYGALLSPVVSLRDHTGPDVGGQAGRELRRQLGGAGPVECGRG